MSRASKRKAREAADLHAARMASHFFPMYGSSTVFIRNADVVDALRDTIAAMLRRQEVEFARPVSLEVAAHFPGFDINHEWSGRAWLAVVLDDAGMPFAAVAQEGPADIPRVQRAKAARSAAIFMAWRASFAPPVNRMPVGSA
ncbi:hypothetical protein [Paracoccus siganidrum]|uniref:Uncharacterized protein n=1 Tax=Paracoccus siganidrum TaxID=1276757 RepID=A0A419A7P5_9RHOB|nr:hypothetical protein [Paracoccus siganidrum]RJL17993.1 hypothetical protein D3P05_08450 [Paracoccus siganidrum]RMC40977.1 hypothetical protein C9E82_00075 [Paracoccus siganidrum]